MQRKTAFYEKLQMVCDLYFDTHSASFSEEDMAAVESRLRVSLPASLKQFYVLFGGRIDFLRCMYDIASPKALCLENNVLMIAKEYQNVCSYGIRLDTQRPVYFDDSNHITQDLDQSIDDFLIYLLALQGTEYLPCIGKADVKFIPHLEKVLPRLSELRGEGAVFCDRKGIISVVVGNSVFLMAQNDDCMERFEKESGLEIDYL